MNNQDGNSPGKPGEGKLRLPRKTLMGVGPEAHLAPIGEVGHHDVYDDLSDDLELEMDSEASSPEFDEKTQFGAPHNAPGIEEHPSLFAKFDIAKPVLPQPGPPQPSQAEESKAIGHLATEALPAVQHPSFSMPFGQSKPLPAPIKAPAGAEVIVDQIDASDLDSQKTELLQSLFEADSVVPKLLVLDGPNTGQEFFVTGLRATVGRGDSNTIVISDLAASRQHIEIVKNPDDTYTLRDLQSINGTLLNSARIREADLFHGDRIEIGKTTLQFLMQGNVPAQSRQRRIIPAALTTMAGAKNSVAHVPEAQNPQDASRVLTTIFIISAVVCVFLVIGIFWIMTASKDVSKVDGPSAVELAGQRYFAGVEASKDREWSTAEALFEEASKLDSRLKVEQQLERIQREKAAMLAHQEAERLIRQGSGEKAVPLLESIPKDSVYFSSAQVLLRSPKTFEIDEMFVAAQSLVTANDESKARETIAKVLQRVPDHAGALELLDQLDRAEAARKAEAERKAEADRKAAATSTSRPAKGEIDDIFSESRSASVNFTDGFRLYRDRDFKGAVSFFESIAKSQEGAVADRALKTTKDIQSFARALEAAEAAHEAKKWKDAEKHFVTARRADSAVAGGKGYFDAEISRKLSDVKANLGLEAFARKDFAAAFALQKDSLALHSKGEKGKELQESLLVEARSMYIRAAGERKTNPANAAKLCRTIMTMLPSTDPTYEKAQAMLKEL